MPDRKDPADVGVSLAGGLFSLAAHAASIWCQEVDDEVVLLEDFCRREMVRILTKRSGLDQREISAHVDKMLRRLRAEIADARKARREVTAERGRAAD